MAAPAADVLSTVGFAAGGEAERLLLHFNRAVHLVAGALLLTGKQLTTPVWIGILMLMGIVTKNAIMLVEFSIESIHKGVPRDMALVDAGQKRARPIIMTTIAMVAGMLPSALSFGAGGEIRSPMALGPSSIKIGSPS